MKPFNRPSSGQLPGADLQTLGDLKLPVGSDVERAIRAWLLETLLPLKLDTHFVDRISISAQEAVVRAAELSSTAPDSSHLHLLIFCPRDRELGQKTWGFFWIDKLEGIAGDKNLPDHSIEFYLYVEGL